MSVIEKVRRPRTPKEFRDALAALMFDFFGEHGTVEGFGGSAVGEFDNEDLSLVVAVIDRKRHSGAAFAVDEKYGDNARPVLSSYDRRIQAKAKGLAAVRATPLPR